MRDHTLAMASSWRSADVLFITDDQQRIVMWSPSAESALGHRAEDAVGKRCYEVMVGTGLNGHPVCRFRCSAVENARRGRVTRHYEIVARRSDGERVLLSTSLVLMPGEAGGNYLMHVCQIVHGVLGNRALASPITETAPVPASISRRELMVLRRLAQGESADEIAAALSIGRITVRNHINNIERKLGAHNRLEMVLLATRNHLL